MFDCKFTDSTFIKISANIKLMSCIKGPFSFVIFLYAIKYILIL